MSCSIRAVTIADAQAIARLAEQLGYDLTARHAAERIRRIVDRPDQLLLVADVDGTPVGWVHGIFGDYLEAERSVIVAGLVVDRAHRRQGIARMLMERVEAWGADEGCVLVRLTSSSTRAGAHRFYQQLGYEIVKTQYSFAKSLDPARPFDLHRLVPRVDR